MSVTNLGSTNRLVKEMRLEGISTMDQANAWIDQFAADHSEVQGEAGTFISSLF